VKEMLDGHHKDYTFHHIVTEVGVKAQAVVVRCSRCDGWFEQKSSPSGEFYGCSNFPYCEERAIRCERCGTQSLVRQTRTYVCAHTACRHTQRICPPCGTGALQARTGKYGPFLGCSNYA
jgi:DNA helicase IV